MFTHSTSTFIFVYPCFLCVCLGSSCMSRLTSWMFNHAQAGVVARPLWRLSPAWENGVKKDAGNYWEWVLWFIVIVIFKKALHSFNPLMVQKCSNDCSRKVGMDAHILGISWFKPPLLRVSDRKLQMVDSSCCCSELMLSDAPNMDRTK